MKDVRALAVGIACWVTLSCPPPVSAGNGVKQVYRLPSQHALPLVDKLPLYFIENRGQLDAPTEYYVQGADNSIYFAAGGVTFVLSEGARYAAARSLDAESVGKGVFAGAARRVMLQLDFVGGDPSVKPRGEALAPATISYFTGPQSSWHTGLKTYRRLVYSDLWPGIDLVYSGTVNRLKYLFVVKPGADLQKINLRYRGADSVSIDSQGRLEVQTALGSFHDDKPSAYQELEGANVDVTVDYQVACAANGSCAYGFRLGDYDSAKPLVIDPAILVYAGFIGGTGDDRGNAIAVDASGNAYVTGGNEFAADELS